MPLRDIRPDLKERLTLIEEQGKAENVEYERDLKALQDGHKARIEQLAEEWRSVNSTLAAENKRLGVSAVQPPTESAVESPAPTKPLDDYLVERVRQHGSRSKADLKADTEAMGYAPPGEAGRKLHFTLINIVRAKRLVQVGDKYVLPPPSPPGGLDFGERRVQ